MVEDQRGSVKYKPWDHRKYFNPEKTFCGRVVYERPKHYFSLNDLERISAKIKPPSKPDGNKFIRLLRAIHMLSAGTAIPFPLDRFDSVFAYLRWAVENTLLVVSDPYGALRTRTVELIVALADMFGIEIVVK